MTHLSETLREPSSVPGNLYHALTDLRMGFKAWRVWGLLAWQDIRLRYRRSTLGPLWITLSMAITIFCMGFLYGKLFKMDLGRYFPFLAIGLLVWNLISSLLNESANTFIESEHFIKQRKQPYSIFIFRIIARNFLIFAHNSLVLIPIFFIFHLSIHLSTLFLLVLGLLSIALNAANYGVLIALLSTRFRDIGPVVSSLLQVTFFLTPIMWTPEILPSSYQFIINLNPFTQFVSAIRDPLLGVDTSLYMWFIILIFTLLGLGSSMIVFSRYRARIPYWL